jgi:hypothetical protein
MSMMHPYVFDGEWRTICDVSGIPSRFLHCIYKQDSVALNCSLIKLLQHGNDEDTCRSINIGDDEDIAYSCYNIAVPATATALLFSPDAPISAKFVPSGDSSEIEVDIPCFDTLIINCGMSLSLSLSRSLSRT